MSVKDCFNKAADTYDQHCELQLKTGEKLLSLIKPAETVIDLGCGTGLITKKLKYKKLYALDLSDKMLSIARSRLDEQNVTFLETDFDNLNNIKFDLAFANLSLQWSNDLPSTLANIKASLNPGGILAFSIPIEGTFEDLTIPTILFLSSQKLKALLSDWQIIHFIEEEIVYYFPSLIEALKSIKAAGANYCNSSKRSFISRYKTQQNLKYKIAYFVVRKPYA